MKELNKTINTGLKPAAILKEMIIRESSPALPFDDINVLLNRQIHRIKVPLLNAFHIFINDVSSKGYYSGFFSKKLLINYPFKKQTYFLKQKIFKKVLEDFKENKQTYILEILAICENYLFNGHLSQFKKYLYPGSYIFKRDREMEFILSGIISKNNKNLLEEHFRPYSLSDFIDSKQVENLYKYTKYDIIIISINKRTALFISQFIKNNILKFKEDLNG